MYIPQLANHSISPVVLKVASPVQLIMLYILLFYIHFYACVLCEIMLPETLLLVKSCVCTQKPVWTM